MSFDEERRADNNNRSSSSSSNIHSVRYVEPRPRDMRDTRDTRDPRDMRDRDMERDREIRERERYERPRERGVRDKRLKPGLPSNQLLTCWFVSDITMISSTTGSVSWPWRRADTTPTWPSTAASPGPQPPATPGRQTGTTRTPSGEYRLQTCLSKKVCACRGVNWIMAI